MKTEGLPSKKNITEVGVFPDRVPDEVREGQLADLSEMAKESRTIKEQMVEKAKIAYLENRESLPHEQRLKFDKEFGLEDNVVNVDFGKNKTESSFPKLNLSDPRQDDTNKTFNPEEEGRHSETPIGMNADLSKLKSEISSFADGNIPDYKTGNLQGDKIKLSEKEDRWNIGNRKLSKDDEFGEDEKAA